MPRPAWTPPSRWSSSAGCSCCCSTAAALALASRLLASHRDEESALLAARGAARWQLVKPSLPKRPSRWRWRRGRCAGGGKLAAALLSSLTGHTQAAATDRASLAGRRSAGVFCLGIVLWPALRPAGIAAVRVRRGRQAAVASAACGRRRHRADRARPAGRPRIAQLLSGRARDWRQRGRPGHRGRARH